MRFHRTDFLDLITFGQCRRQMFSELFELLAGVESPGRHPGALDLTAFSWGYARYVECGGNTRILRSGPQITLYEDADSLVQRDALGRDRRLTTHLPVTAPRDSFACCPARSPIRRPLVDVVDDRWRGAGQGRGHHFARRCMPNLGRGPGRCRGISLPRRGANLPPDRRDQSRS